MMKRFKGWMLNKPEKTRLLIYFGLYFIYWFLMWVLWDSIILKEKHNIGYYFFYGLWLSVGWLIFNNWNLIKSVFSRKDKS